MDEAVFFFNVLIYFLYLSLIDLKLQGTHPNATPCCSWIY